MATLNTKYYNEERGYSDGELEGELYERISSGQTPAEILESDSRWPVYYHLSPKRENILNWYPFKPGASVLEVGSGLGALTGMLCEVSGKVTSVELTLDRARVNYERNRDRDNLEIYVGNLENMVFDEKFDYIILNGVLEYALSFTDSETPYEDFLNQIRRFLKPGGTVLIAIENRFGLKYFNGVPEDHTARLFSGIDGYPYTDNVRTFTKGELRDLLGRAGFEDLNFYYPNPDYKFPQVVYSDDSLSMVDTRVDTDSFNLNRVRMFDESEVLRTLLEEGIADRFFNSFLVEARDGEAGERVIFAKISDKRRPEFQTMTKIVAGDEKKVYKDPLTPEAREHVERLSRYYDENPSYGRFKNVPLTVTETGLAFDYVEGETYDKKLTRLLKAGDIQGFAAEIRAFREELYRDTEIREDYCRDEFSEVFGPTELTVPMHVKPRSNIDLIFTNIISGDEDTIIDYEWIMDFGVPQEFVLWRSLYYLYENSLKGMIDFDKILKLSEIDPGLHETFLAWDDHFGNHYILNESDEIYKSRTVDALPYLEEIISNSDTASSLYLDFGEGYSEENRIISQMEIDGEDFRVDFDLTPLLGERPLKSLRWDPLETVCALSGVEIDSDAVELGLYDILSKELELDGVSYFLDEDPYVFLLGDYEGLSRVRLSGKIRLINSGEAISITRRIQEKLREKQAELERGQQEIYDMNTQIRNLERRGDQS